LYGIDSLIESKEEDKSKIDFDKSSVTSLNPPESSFIKEALVDDVIRWREEISEQIKALNQIKEMAAMYGFDISKPAKNAIEAIQWTYF